MQPKKSLGQHWLNDMNAIDAMIEAGHADPEVHVLEIGPGQGVMTEAILAMGCHVTAVEYDPDLYRVLKADSANLFSEDAERLTLIQQDILEFDLSSLPAGYRVIANIPYYITQPIIRKLLEADNKPARIALLVQKEVAERVCALPGQMSVLSISAQFYAECSLAEVVPASSFTPPPKVDSQILVLEPYDKPKFDIDEKNFFRLVKAGFSEKRKKLINSLSGGLQMDKSKLTEIVVDLGWSDTIRAQELSLEQWHDLYSALKKYW